MKSSSNVKKFTLIKDLEKKFQIKNSSTYEKSVNFKQSSQTPIHRWFKYREGFSPTILDGVGDAHKIYDPFSGCGTTLIEAKSRGISAIGTEVNPLAVFVAKVKTQNYNSADIAEFERRRKKAITDNHDKKSRPPELSILGKLFQPEALDELLRLRAYIEDCSRKKTKQLLFLSWLSILEKCSNVFKEGNGLKYRNKRRQPGTYETIPDEIWIAKYFGPCIKTFVQKSWAEQCQVISNDLKANSSTEIKSQIIEMSCLEKDIQGAIGFCDAAVFSPPYANRFDYFEAFKLELWMGGFVHTAREMQQLRQRSMRNNLSVANGSVSEWEVLEPFLELMDNTASSVRMGIKDTLKGYFDDMSTLVKNLHGILKTDGKVICVVGNSAYAGVIIPTDILCAQIFEEGGFQVDSVNVARHLTVSSQQRSQVSHKLTRYMRESVLVCTRQ